MRQVKMLVNRNLSSEGITTTIVIATEIACDKSNATDRRDHIILIDFII